MKRCPFLLIGALMITPGCDDTAGRKRGSETPPDLGTDARTAQLPEAALVEDAAADSTPISDPNDAASMDVASTDPMPADGMPADAASVDALAPDATGSDALVPIPPMLPCAVPPQADDAAARDLFERSAPPDEPCDAFSNRLARLPTVECGDERALDMTAVGACEPSGDLILTIPGANTYLWPDPAVFEPSVLVRFTAPVDGTWLFYVEPVDLPYQAMPLDARMNCHDPFSIAVETQVSFPEGVPLVRLELDAGESRVLRVSTGGMDGARLHAHPLRTIPLGDPCVIDSPHATCGPEGRCQEGICRPGPAPAAPPTAEAWYHAASRTVVAHVTGQSPDGLSSVSLHRRNGSRRRSADLASAADVAAERTQQDFAEYRHDRDGRFSATLTLESWAPPGPTERLALTWLDPGQGRQHLDIPIMPAPIRQAGEACDLEARLDTCAAGLVCSREGAVGTCRPVPPACPGAMAFNDLSGEVAPPDGIGVFPLVAADPEPRPNGCGETGDPVYWVRFQVRNAGRHAFRGSAGLRTIQSLPGCGLAHIPALTRMCGETDGSGPVLFRDMAANETVWLRLSGRDAAPTLEVRLVEPVAPIEVLAFAPVALPGQLVVRAVFDAPWTQVQRTGVEIEFLDAEGRLIGGAEGPLDRSDTAGDEGSSVLRAIVLRTEHAVSATRQVKLRFRSPEGAVGPALIVPVVEAPLAGHGGPCGPYTGGCEAGLTCAAGADRTCAERNAPMPRFDDAEVLLDSGVGIASVHLAPDPPPEVFDATPELRLLDAAGETLLPWPQCRQDRIVNPAVCVVSLPVACTAESASVAAVWSHEWGEFAPVPITRIPPAADGEPCGGPGSVRSCGPGLRCIEDSARSGPPTCRSRLGRPRIRSARPTLAQDSLELSVTISDPDEDPAALRVTPYGADGEPVLDLEGFPVRNGYAQRVTRTEAGDLDVEFRFGALALRGVSVVELRLVAVDSAGNRSEPFDVPLP